MLNRFFVAIFVFAVVFLHGDAARAQSTECQANYEMITKLFHPDYAAPVMWETNYGEGNAAEEFSAVTLPVDATVGAVAAGTTKQEAEQGVEPRLLLLKVDHRGRPVWERQYAVSGLAQVVKILPRAGGGADGYFVIANVKSAQQKRGLWVGAFDALGTLQHAQLIGENDADIMAHDMIVDFDDEGYVVALVRAVQSGAGKSSVIKKEAALYKIDGQAHVTQKRIYTMGGNSEIFGLSKAQFKGDKRGYIAAGYLENGIGKKSAFVMRLDADFAIDWQQEYNRGLHAELRAARLYYDRYILAFGTVRPSDAGAVGGWLMLVDAADGKTHWQRFYYGESGQHDYQARGLYVNKDGLINLLMAAKVSPEQVHIRKEKQKAGGKKLMVGDLDIPLAADFAHVLVVSPRGVTLSGASYFFGQNALASQWVEGHNGERIIVGQVLAQASVINNIKDVTPEWDRDFALRPAAIDEGKAVRDVMANVNLPQAQLSENTKSGLALLNKKMREQQAKTPDKNRPKSESVQAKKEVKSVGSDAKLSRNAWLVAGEAPQAYTDPCRNPVTDIPQ